MPDLEDHATLHPATVSNAEEHAKTTPKRRHRVRNYRAERERAQARKDKEQPRHIRSVRVDPQVWATAMQLAGGEVGRIVVHNDTEVVVANHSRHTRPVMTPQFELTPTEDEPPVQGAGALEEDRQTGLTIVEGAHPTTSGRSGPGKSVKMNPGQVFTCPICGNKFSNKLGHNRPAQGRGLHMYRSHGVKPEDYDGNHALLEPTAEVDEA